MNCVYALKCVHISQGVPYSQLDSQVQAKEVNKVRREKKKNFRTAKQMNKSTHRYGI